MTTSNKIPDALEPVLICRAGQINPATGKRWTTRDLAAWLRTEHGIEVFHTTVGRCLQRLRAEAAAVRQAAARDALTRALRTSLRRLRDYERRLAAKVPANAKAGTLASTMELQRRVVDTLAKHGLGEKLQADIDVTTDGQPLDARHQLATSLARLAGTPLSDGEGEAGGGPGAQGGRGPGS